MDPQAEYAHRVQEEQSSSTPTARERVVETIAGALLLGTCAALVAVDGVRSPDLALAGAFVVLIALFWQVTFRIGPASTMPLQLLFVPMWASFDPALLPLIVAAGQVLGNVISSMRSPDQHHWGRVLIGIPDAWYAVGPAVVLVAFEHDGIALDDWWIYLLALIAQQAVDAITGIARSRATTGINVRDHLGDVSWIWMVDSALSPIGFAVALSMPASPLVLLTLLPLTGLLRQFAKERDDRIMKALELSSAYRGTAQLMGDVLEADDAYTGGEHTQGVVELSLAVGAAIGLGAREMRTLEFGALLHDIGKLRVPNEIINKPGKLTEDEWAIIKLHPGWGQEMLDRVGGELSHAGEVVRAHHERWDGAGYPDGLAGEEIPVEARIITVCDSYSAMTTDRSYRKGMGREEAVAELRRCAGSQFDPRLVDALEQVIARLPAPLQRVEPPRAA
ncbi:MAG: HD-GYP domain-containing protein [Patulibacter minatonensis]